jgi:hypothetical protein
MKRNALLLFFFLLVASAAQLQAQATLSIQGVIKNADGSAVSNGKYSLQFNLYTAASGGTAVWSETQPEVQVTGGIYSALLGEVNPLNAAFDQPYYLGVSVEGGAELIPRARLTSSPYALSLIGQSNSFPSSGAVGVGTASPSGTANLHVKNSSSDAVLLVESPGNMPRIILKDADQTAELKVEGNELKLQANDNLPLSINSNDKVFISQNNSAKLEINSNVVKTINGAALNSMRIGVDTLNSLGGDMVIQRSGQQIMTLYSDKINTSRPLEIIPPLVTYFTTLGNHWLYGNGAQQASTGTLLYGIRSTEPIIAPYLVAYSDRRIKKNFRLSDGAEDLANLMRLRVTDYQYIDSNSKGNGSYKGLVAQEVHEVIPEVVMESADFIPNIFTLSEKPILNEGQLILTISQEHGLVAGDKVRLLLKDGVRDCLVESTADTRRFSIAWAEEAPMHVFVYGKKVDDFLQLDYDQVHNLAISAIQELSRQVDALKIENAGLKTDLKTTADDFERRLRTLESKLSH